MKELKKKTISVRTAQTSLGPVELPVYCSDGSAVVAFFKCDFDVATQKLAGTGLYPVEFFKGQTLAMLGLFEYREALAEIVA